MAIFDILTRPDPNLNDDEPDQVRNVARTMMERITGVLVADWRKKSQTQSRAMLESEGKD